jgi:hypothetical protein
LPSGGIGHGLAYGAKGDGFDGCFGDFEEVDIRLVVSPDGDEDIASFEFVDEEFPCFLAFGFVGEVAFSKDSGEMNPYFTVPFILEPVVPEGFLPFPLEGDGTGLAFVVFP